MESKEGIQGLAIYAWGQIAASPSPLPEKVIAFSVLPVLTTLSIKQFIRSLTLAISSPIEFI